VYPEHLTAEKNIDDTSVIYNKKRTEKIMWIYLAQNYCGWE
jgi:hypothetical protein